MGANGFAKKGQPHPAGHWGKWRGVSCSEPGCESPASARGLCKIHYGRKRTAEGYRPPSTKGRARKNIRLRHRYGIGIDDYDAMLKKQKGGCAICRRPASDGSPEHWGETFCVDHCHETGEVRGLLCNDCNLIVGRGRDADLLRRAVKYLLKR